MDLVGLCHFDFFPCCFNQAARKERRFKAIHGSNKAAERIVKNYLRAKALETVTGRKRYYEEFIITSEVVFVSYS